MDGDLDNDIMSTNEDGIIYVGFNSGGTFPQSPVYNPGGHPGGWGLFAIDLSGDGLRDIAVTAYTVAPRIRIFMNNGDGTFAAPDSQVIGLGSESVFGANLDGDLDNDLVTANGTDDNVSVLLNSGGGVFAPAVSYPVGNDPRSVYVFDLDQDGDQDLAVANSNHKVSTLLNNGDGTFGAAVHHQSASTPRGIVAADLDGDGDGDLAATNYESSTVSVLMNCLCPCNADPANCDGLQNVSDVVQTINVAFRGSPSILDPNPLCTFETTDNNCSSSTDIVDVVKMVNVAFRGGNPNTEFCNACD
jgi:hypothetical protein